MQSSPARLVGAFGADWSQWRACTVLALALTVTGVAWYDVRNAAQEEARLRFQAETERIRLHVSSRLGAYEQVLQGGVSVVDTWHSVNRDQWRSYVTGLEIGRNYPGIQGIGYAVIVPPDGVADHVAQIRAESYPSYTIHPAGERSVYSAIIYLEPFDWRNQRAFGFDMLSEPVRGTAMERARDTGETAVSGRVSLVQETEVDEQPGFLMYLPVYRSGASTTSRDARRQALIAYVYAPFRMHDLMGGILGGQLQNIRLQIFDGATTTAEALLFDSVRPPTGVGTTAAEPLLTRSIELDLPGHLWTLRFSTLPSFAAVFDTEKPLIVGVAGALVSTLIFLVTWSSARNEERMRQKEADFRYLFEKNPSIMWVHDRRTLEFLEVNDATLTLYGYSRDEFKRMRIIDLRPSEDVLQPPASSPEPGCGDSHSGESQHRLGDGQLIEVEVQSHDIDFEGAEATLVVARDVTERNRAEAVLKESAESARSVIETSLDAFVRIDQHSRILEWNRAAETLFGWTREEAIGSALANLIIPPAARDAHARGMRHFLATGEGPILNRRIEVTGLHKNGDPLRVELTVTPMRGLSGHVFNAFVRDLTDRLEAEARLRERTDQLELSNRRLQEEIAERQNVEDRLRASEAHYRDVVDLIHEGIWIHCDGHVVFANAHAAHLFGLAKRDELIGRSPMELVHPEDREQARRRTRTVVEDRQPVSPIEVTLIRADGRPVLAEIQAVPYSHEGRPAVLAVARDITQRKETESLLRQAQKMEAIGQLTGGLAHDFNNLLTVVIGNLDLLQMELKSSPKAEGLAEIALRASLRGAELTRQLLAFARRQSLEVKAFDLNGLVSGTTGLLRRTLGEQIEVEMTLADGLWGAFADPTQVESALANLAINARDAMPDGGRLSIETADKHLDERYAAENAEVSPGDYVMLAVSDTGTGIPPEILGRVFEPFFTTKEQGKGTGLGLSMVYGFAKQSQGHVKIYSEVGHGTTVRLYLPRAKAEAIPLAEETAIESEGATNEATILVVEDNADVRSVAARQLTELGYRVIEAGDAASALEVLRRDQTIDLLFTDVVMPGGMTGADLAREAANLRPALKVLFTSGFAEASIHNGARSAEIRSLLSKPYRKQDLAGRVREVLCGNGGRP
jgi:PAS domain S-box-containing protein